MNLRSAGSPRGRRPGPGLPESLVWVSAYHAAQFLAALLLVVLLIVVAFDGWPDDFTMLLQAAREFAATDLHWFLAALIGSATLGALFLILPAAFWRLRPDPRAKLGMHLPRGREMLLLTGAVLPMGIVSDELYRFTSQIMESLQALFSEQVPMLASFDQGADTVTLIQHQAATTAYPLLLVVVGLGPAIGEEIIFRGLIGRGLIARWGLFRGIALTSLLFAAAHVSPAHAVATLPIAVFLHLAYRATGSIWAPIGVHFLNNALSVSTMKFGLGEDFQTSTILLISAVVYVIVTAILLFGGPIWRTRPSVPEVSMTPVTSGAGQLASSIAVAPSWFLILATSGVLSFTCSFVIAATGGL